MLSYNCVNINNNSIISSIVSGNKDKSEEKTNKSNYDICDNSKYEDYGVKISNVKESRYSDSEALNIFKLHKIMRLNIYYHKLVKNTFIIYIISIFLYMVYF